MKKVQLPVLGGMRKVILPGGNNTVAGTTIAEVGAGTITLAQLAAAITNIQQQNTNNGGGNIGSGSAAAVILVPGQGLAGGGPLIGSVPIRLNVPIPWDGDGDGGSDGDPGPPGAAGVAGAAGAAGAPGSNGGIGPAGPAIFLEAEPGDDGLWAVPGPVGPQGVAGAVGATGPQGPSGSGSGGGGSGTLMFMVPEDTSYNDEIVPGVPSSVGALSVIGPLSVNSTMNFGQGTFAAATLAQISFSAQNLSISADNFKVFVGTTPTLALQILSNAVLSYTGNSTLTANSGVNLSLSGASNVNGLNINAAGGSNTYYIQCISGVSGLQVFRIFGDGAVVVGPAAVQDIGLGTVNAAKGYYVNGCPISAPAGMIADETWTDEEIYRGPTNGPVSVNGYFTILSPTPQVAAGQTALGITTTATVITTAGGIALPALASTFWVVNVNGVQYGIPCFAL